MFRPLVTFPFAQQHHTTVRAYSPPAAVTSSRPLVTFAQQTTVWKTGSNGLESTVRPLVWISLGLSTTTVWCGVVSVGREMVGCGSALLPHWNQIGAVSVWILAHYQVHARRFRLGIDLLHAHRLSAFLPISPAISSAHRSPPRARIVSFLGFQFRPPSMSASPKSARHLPFENSRAQTEENLGTASKFSIEIKIKFSWMPNHLSRLEFSDSRLLSSLL